MASTSKGRPSRRKPQAPGKLRITLKDKGIKVESDDGSNFEDSDEEEATVENGIPKDLPEGTIVVQPEAVEDSQTKSKKAPVRIDTSVLDNVTCTACGRQLNPYKNGAFQKHPELKVIICRRCEKFLSSGEISKDKDGSDEQCRWCGQGGRLSVCDECSKAFCKGCIMRNFNRSEFNKINDQKYWRCYLCDKAPLQSLRENYRNVRDTLKALQARDKAKATAAANTNGRASSWKPGNVSQESTCPAARDVPSSGSVFSGLSAEDLRFDSKGLAAFLNRLSVATNTFRDTLRALRSQFESRLDDEIENSPLKFKFSMSSSELELKERRCAEALSMGLEVYFKSLKAMLVAQKKQEDNVQSLVREETFNSYEKNSKDSTSKCLKENIGTSVSYKRQRETHRSTEKKTSSPKIKSFTESTKSSGEKRKSGSKNDVILLSDTNEDGSEEEENPQSPMASSLESLKKQAKPKPSEKQNQPSVSSYNEAENMAAKLELLNEETSQSDVSNEDENVAAKLELLNEQTSSSCEAKDINGGENIAAKNDLLVEGTVSCDSEANKTDENMAAKFDLLNELAEKIIDDDGGGDGVEEKEKSLISSSSSASQKEIPEKGQQEHKRKGPEHKNQKVRKGRKQSKDESTTRDNVPADFGNMSTSDEDEENSRRKKNSKRKTIQISKDEDVEDNSRSLEKVNATKCAKDERKGKKTEGEKGSYFESDEDVGEDIRESLSKEKLDLDGFGKAGNVSDSETKKIKRSDRKTLVKSSTPRKKTTALKPVMSDVSSSDLLLSSDDECDSTSAKTRKKKKLNCKDTAAQENTEKSSAKGRQPEVEKEQEKIKKPSLKSDLEVEKSEKSLEERQPSSKSEAKNDSSKKLKEAKPKLNGEKKEIKTEERDEDEMDKEIEKLSKLPTMRKRKAKDMEGEEDDGDVDTEDKRDQDKAPKKYKPGPKSSKTGKKSNNYDNLSSDDEKPASELEEDDENDDLEPSVTFFLGPESKENNATNGQDEGMEDTSLGDKENDDSEQEEEKDENKEDESSSSNEDEDDKKKKTKKNQESHKNKSDQAEKEKDEADREKDEEREDLVDSDDEKTSKKKSVHDKLLDAKISDSDGSDIGRKKKKKKASDEEASQGDESSSGSSVSSDSVEEDDDSEDMSDEDGDESKKKKKGKKKGKGRKKKGKGKKGSDGAEEGEGSDEDANKKKGKGKRRRRIKKVADSSDEEEKEEDDDDDDEKNKSGKRKQIRKVMSNKKLEDSTRAAAKAEEKRRKRIAAKQREFNIETITDENNPMNCPITTKLILEPGKEEGDSPVVEVNKKLIQKLKPHQVEAVQFMWDCMFESVKRSKKEEGAGCILAHCMGLGKTLSVISFVHTVLSHSKVLNQKTCLVVSPLNTVLNWQNEWGMWLDEEDQFDVWELASCKQNPARANMLKEWHASGGIMIIGYEMYRNLSQGARCKNKRQKKIFHETLVDPGPDLVVCDEGHILKNEASSISKAMNQMKTRRRVVLTGTPLQNNLNEYHCMVSFVKPNLLGTRREFTNRFISPIQNGQCTDSTQRDVKLMKARAHVLHEMLAGCVQRRDYSALTKFLPPKQEYVISVRLTDVQIDLYDKYLEMSGQGVDGVYTNKGARLFSDYQNLMKIWTHPWVLKLAEIRDELKMKYDDEDSFIDDESEGERSFSSSDSSSEGEKMNLSDSGGEGTSLGPHSKKGTRRTRAKARRQAGEDSDPEEVIAEWKSKTRNGEPKEEEEPVTDGPKSVTKEWWAAYVTEEDQHKLELSNKLFLLFEILKMCEEIGDKVLIFSQSILSLNIIENFLETVDSKFQQECEKLNTEEPENEKEQFGRSWTKNLDYYRMDGSTSAQNRQAWAANFNDIDNHRTRLFLISTKAGGLGINLVAANRVIIFDASWNPSHDVQSIFRVYRFGQTKPCYIYRFLAQGTMEEKIYERQVTKLSLSQRVVDEHQIERHFSANDLKELYNFKPDRWNDGTEKPTLALPKDPLLAEILTNHKHCVLSFHEHDSLLENQIEQTLTEEEKKAAWEEYENEKKGIIIRGPGMERTASWPMMAAAQILSRQQITATVQALRQRLPDISEELFHLHVQQELRRQVQVKQEEMRRMEMLRMQEIQIMNMIKYQAQQTGLTYEEVQTQMAPWIQMQMQQMHRMRAMQSHLMAAGTSGMHSGSLPMMGNMGVLGEANAERISNNPEDAINLDDN